MNQTRIDQILSFTPKKEAADQGPASWRGGAIRFSAIGQPDPARLATEAILQ